MTRGTMLWVVAALASVLTVVLTTPAEKPAVVARDEGEPLCPALTDPALVTRLEVRRWNTDEAQPERFVVEQRDGVWTIPSHGGYPAEATERMARAAGSLVGITKAVVRGDRPEEHAEFGVLDPDDASAGEGKGERITLSDATGAILADVIVGKPVPGQARRRFVRLADSNRVYEAELRLEVSTRFADWIDPDVLDLRREEIVAVTLHSYSVDEASGRVLGDEPVKLVKVETSVDAALSGSSDRGGSGPAWAIAPPGTLPPGKRLDKAKVEALLSAIDQMTIVGVRPQPEVLTDVALRKKGFFVAPPRIFGNEGELEVELKDGTVVAIYFGEVAPSSGLALTAGVGEDDGGVDGRDLSGEGPRYVFLTASHRQGLSDAGTGAAGPPIGRETPPGAAAGGVADAGVPPTTDGTEGAQRAARLQGRFSKWFFVIDGGTFAKMRPMPDTLFADASVTGSTP